MSLLDQLQFVLLAAGVVVFGCLWGNFNKENR